VGRKRYSSAQSNDGQHAVATARWHGLKMDAEVMQYEWGFGVLEESGVGSGRSVEVEGRLETFCQCRSFLLVAAVTCSLSALHKSNVHWAGSTVRST